MFHLCHYRCHSITVPIIHNYEEQGAQNAVPLRGGPALHDAGDGAPAGPDSKDLGMPTQKITTLPAIHRSTALPS